MKKLKKIAISASVFMPMMAFAAAINEVGDVAGVFKSWLDLALPLLIGAAVVWVSYGAFKYIRTDDANAREEARGTVVYGIIGLFVMVSIWGLVGVLSGTFSVTGNVGSVPNIPNIPGI